MHELSIAQAVLDQVRRHTPVGAVVRAVFLNAGPLRGLDADAMTWAWQATTAGSDLASSKIHVQVSPWHLVCPQCGRTWDSPDLEATCSCGCDRPHPTGGDELQLLSIEVEEQSAPRMNPEEHQ